MSCQKGVPRLNEDLHWTQRPPATMIAEELVKPGYPELMAREPRERLVERIAAAAGPGIIKVKDLRNGWPSLATVMTSDGPRDVSLHLSGVGEHHRPGDPSPYERRFTFAGAGRPVKKLPGTIAITAGLSLELGPPIVAAPQGLTSGLIGRDTRKTVLFSVGVIENAMASQWATHINGKGEQIHAFVPKLFPLFVELEVRGIQLDGEHVGRQAVRSGILDTPTDENRARASVSALVRSARFSHEVRNAYEHRCAMCDLGMGIVVGAHIWPVAAPGAPDHVSNGLALCENHHAAFDRHLIGVIPKTFEIRIHPDVQACRSSDPAIDHFLKGTKSHLRPPKAGAEPDPEMFEKRLSFAGSQAAWIMKGREK